MDAARLALPLRPLRALVCDVRVLRWRPSHVLGALVLGCVAALVVLAAHGSDASPYSGRHLLALALSSHHAADGPHDDGTVAGVDFARPDAPFVAWPLARLCGETTWVPGVVFMCDNNSGGLGNLRSFVLTCVRYAIAAGATGLVLPAFETRSAADLGQLFSGGRRPFGYVFDARHFVRSLSAACPRLIIYADVAHVPGVPLPPSPRATPLALTPKTLGSRGGCDRRDINRHTDMFGAQFHGWLAETTAGEADRADKAGTGGKRAPAPVLSADRPCLVQPVWGVQWEWPVAKDGPELANSFGGLLRLRSDVLVLGRATADAMQQVANRRGAGAGARASGFAGVHLRTEHDALSFWPTFDTQATAFLASVRAKGFRSVYLATGNATEAARFIERATTETNVAPTDHDRLQISTKTALLRNQPARLQQLQALTWDQQALVDYVVLLECDYFVGVSPSSFSMSVAARRRLALDGLRTRPWPVDNVGDARSRLVGNYTHYWDDWLFMYDTLWP